MAGNRGTWDDLQQFSRIFAVTGLDVEDGESADIIVALFKHLITIMGKTDFSNKLADDIVWILLMEVCLYLA